MAAANEMLSSTLLIRKPSPIPSSMSPFLGGAKSRHFSPVLISGDQAMRRGAADGRKIVSAPILAVISERPVVRTVVTEKQVNFKVRALVTIKRNAREDIKEKIANHFDAVADKLGRSVVLELISTEVDSRTKRPKRSGEAALKNWFESSKAKGDEKMVCAAEFTVDSTFGVAGAVAVRNRHRKEFFLESVVVEGFLTGPVFFYCNSWVQSIKDLADPGKRVFFTDKAFLPAETPAGLKKLRREQLNAKRGDGTGERKLSDRVYDYEVYNDLGNPDKGPGYERPTLGGAKMPFPRRCRTGRRPMNTDATAESRVEAPLPLYVPRDEAFEEKKQKMLDEGQTKAMLHVFAPSMAATSEECHDIAGFHELDSLYKIGLESKQVALLKNLPFASSKIREAEAMLRYDTPSIIKKDKFAWLRDDEFARQTLAGINPVSIERLQVFPPVSKLDPAAYGPPESAIKEEHIIGHLNGLTVREALDEKKLFVLDFHDMYLPFLDRINAQHGRKTYATRTLYFLTPLGTLKPIAIELSLPPGTPESRRKRVITPPADATTSWLWQLAKAHVCSNDAGVHQLVNHWLRTHACMEPFILAAHRQLSEMHPIFKLLQPHMRYNLEINALARQILISAGGVIESFFTPGSVSMEMSAAAYRSAYRFDQETLPADLIRRGMAEPDPTQPHGVKLVLEDYPYAADGLMIWSAIKKWVSAYVKIYYPDPHTVQSDAELQQWYYEAVNVGHADLRGAEGWPDLSTPADLVRILSTIIWNSSAQHAALNFAQYPLGGYIPNRPTLTRRLVPEEGDPEYKSFLADPERFFLSSLPSLMQAAKLMTVIDTLSTHSEDEEYLGERGRQTYGWVPEVAEAFSLFAAEVRRIEAEIERRNGDAALRNRCGAGVLPYELLMPSSGPGITGRGVPNSITI